MNNIVMFVESGVSRNMHIDIKYISLHKIIGMCWYNILFQIVQHTFIVGDIIESKTNSVKYVVNHRKAIHNYILILVKELG